MAIIRYEPWNLLNQLQQELERSRDDKSGEGAVLQQQNGRLQ